MGAVEGLEHVRPHCLRNKDPFTKGYCDEFFAGQEAISEDLSITLSRNMIIGLVITVLAIVSIYMMSRKETKI